MKSKMRRKSDYHQKIKRNKKHHQKIKRNKSNINSGSHQELNHLLHRKQQQRKEK